MFLFLLMFRSTIRMHAAAAAAAEMMQCLQSTKERTRDWDAVNLGVLWEAVERPTQKIDIYINANLRNPSTVDT
jgi:hypothetical protein